MRTRVLKFQLIHFNRPKNIYRNSLQSPSDQVTINKLTNLVERNRRLRREQAALKIFTIFTHTGRSNNVKSRIERNWRNDNSKGISIRARSSWFVALLQREIAGSLLFVPETNEGTPFPVSACQSIGPELDEKPRGIIHIPSTASAT